MATAHVTGRSIECTNEYTIMLVGRLGAGKSSLGNFLLKKECFRASDGFAPVTTNSMCESTKLNGEITLRVIDTPGFGDERSDDEVKTDLANAIYEARNGVDAFVLLISAAERIGKDIIDQFEMFEKMMEHTNFLKYVLPVFTKVDQILKNRGETKIHSYEKQKSLVHEELNSEQLKSFNDKFMSTAKDNWLCISSTCKDTIYYDDITKKLIQAIGKIRDSTHNILCTTRLMDETRIIELQVRAKHPKAEEHKIRKMIIQLVIRTIIEEIIRIIFQRLFLGR